ncbi:MAG: DUF2752 domain-containing protein, partial [Candidatus Hydrogenedentes bacterium]|nr:DUF2752 domain-containing protein [Candidatus Hydrogenedentota bacterium]
DIEIVFVSIAGLGLVTGWTIPLTGSALPVCQFHALTGIPCPGCGDTRAAVLLSHGHLIESFFMNPMVALSAVLGGLFAIYSAIVLVFKLPRLRVRFTSKRESLVLWTILAVAALSDWIYLIVVGR